MYNIPVDRLCIRSLTEDLRALYEAGKSIVIENFFAGIDLEMIRSLIVDKADSKSRKKTKTKHLLAPISKPLYHRHVISLFYSDDVAKGILFQKQVTKLNDYMRAVFKELFPGYDIVREDNSWRLSLTEREEMHFDSYGKTGEQDEFVRVRMFINLDSEDRVWRIGPRLDDVCRKYWVRYKLWNHAHLHPNLFNHMVNVLLPWDEVERYEVRFPPMTMWFVDSQFNAHEIVRGRALVANTYVCTPESVLNPGMTFTRKTRRLLKQLEGQK